MANLGLRHQWARWVTIGLLGAAIFIVFASAAADLVAATGPVRSGSVSRAGLLAAGFILLIGSTLSAVLLTRAPRLLAAKWLPIEAGSILDEAALIGVVLLIANSLAFQLTNDALAKVAAAPSLDRLDVLAGELPLLLAALLGVGILTRRSTRAGLGRLGLVRPLWWQVVLGLAAAGVFFVVSQFADQLQHLLTPDLANRLGAATGHLYGGLSDPVGIAVIALGAGIAEEALFRGALQPRLGLAMVAIAFAAVHSQYGISIDTLVVLVLGIGLGLIRKYVNTTTSTITHVGYNTLAGVGVGGALVGPALAVEGVLLGLLVFAAVPLGRRLFQP